jgi:hypothetical protein
MNDKVTFFVDWTNILNHPFKDDVVRVALDTGAVLPGEDYAMMVRYEEEIVSAGVRFHFGGAPHHAAAPPPMIAPPPPPPPAVEQPAPEPAPPLPPPPPPESSGERGQ